MKLRLLCWICHNHLQKDCKDDGERRVDLYAQTPPPAAARFLLSTCASQGKRVPGDYRILLLDIKKAFLHGKISRNVYIELLAKDPMSKGEALSRKTGQVNVRHERCSC